MVLKGRINRKTFAIGNLIAVAILGVISAVIALPLAILDLIIKNSTADLIINFLFYLILFPLALYVFFISVLIVKRAHDFNWPGVLLTICLFGIVFVGKITAIHYFNLLAILIFLFLAIRPGTKTRNNFGASPRKKFRVNDLKINF